tara:strand:- start:1590 stop:2138 length:549 start_codon:yes stop_codon:yes gene_type:complete
MTIQQTILNRRTTHDFLPGKVPQDDILESVKAANFAPCHRLTFPWRFINISDNTRNLIINILLDIKSCNSLLTNDQREKIISKSLIPSNLIIVYQVLHGNDHQKKEDYAACACAIQNMMISLTGFGIGSKWSTGHITRDKRVYELLDLDQDKSEIIGFIWIGYGGTTPSIKRPLLNEVYKEI